MEIHLRTLLFIIASLVGCLSLPFVVDAVPSGAQPATVQALPTATPVPLRGLSAQAEELALRAPTPTVTAQARSFAVVATGGVNLNLRGGPGWDWDNTCEEEVAAWLAGRGLAVEHVTLTLEPDDHTLPIGVAYPSAEDPEALVLSGCDVTESGLACRVAVAASASSAALDAAASVALVAAVADHLRPKDKESWAQRDTWTWDEYRPLLRETEGRWESTCLSMKGG